MSGMAEGFPCPGCGHTVAEIEGYIKGVTPPGYFLAVRLWCIKCEHRWEVPR